MANNEIIMENEGIDTVIYDMPKEKIDKTKLLIGAIGFGAGILATKVVVPLIRNFKESMKIRKHFKEFDEEILDEEDVEIIEDK